MVLNQSLLIIHFIYQHSHECADRRYAFQTESRWKRLCFFHATIKYAYISSTWLLHTPLISYYNHYLQSYLKVYSFNQTFRFTHNWKYWLYDTYESVIIQLNTNQLNIIHTIHRSISNPSIIKPVLSHVLDIHVVYHRATDTWLMDDLINQYLFSLCCCMYMMKLLVLTLNTTYIDSYAHLVRPKDVFTQRSHIFMVSYHLLVL
jgi:hypothetical protein